MADGSGSPLRYPSPPPTPPTPLGAAPRLRYPSLPSSSTSVADWLSQSRPIENTATPMAADNLRPPSSLSENWATLSISDDHSEDGTRSEQTDIGSLIDHSGPDDVASLDGRYSTSEMDGDVEEDEDVDTAAGTDDIDDEEDDEQGQSAISQDLPALPSLLPQIPGAIHGSNISANTAFRQSSESIEFVEPEDWSEERVDLKHEVDILQGTEVVELQERFRAEGELKDCTLTTTIQQTMTRRGLDLDKPFRVLYVGNAEFRNIILDKIGDVLVSSSCSTYECSSTESSRYHVVPTSFGAGAVPNFAELLPIHVQLVVDECVRASTPEPDSAWPRTITLHFKNRPPCTSSFENRTRSLTSATDWTLPDVAIFFISRSDDAEAETTRALAERFMTSHGIPILHISEEPLWRMPTHPEVGVRPESLHMCLEFRDRVTGETRALKRFPIDLKSFESVAPGQLNRNLASLVSFYPKKCCKFTAKKEPSPEGKPVAFLTKSSKMMSQLPFVSSAGDFPLVLQLLGMAIITTLAVSGGFVLLRVALIQLSQFVRLPSTSSDVSPVWAGESLPSPMSSGSRPASLAVQPTATESRPHVADGLTNVEQLISVPLTPREIGARRDEFEIQVVGDCHVVIKAPQGLKPIKKRGSFNVSVQRGDQLLPYELSKLFEGVFTLKVDREEAYGLVNVSIVVDSKPPLRQTVQIDFGTPWLKIANWKRAAQAMSSQLVRDLSIVQTGLTEVYGRLSTDLQVLADVVMKTHVLSHEARLLGHDSVQRTRQARDTVLSRSRAVSEIFRRNALQQYQSAADVLRESCHRANRGAKELVSNTWAQVSSSLHCLQEVDLPAWRSHLDSFWASPILGKAQMQARHLWQRSLSGTRGQTHDRDERGS